MEKNIRLVSCVICIVIGVGLACQMKVSDGQRLYVSPKTIEDYKTTISSEREEIEKLKTLIEETQGKLDIYKSAGEADDVEKQVIEQNLMEEVQKYQMAAGGKKVEGPGVEVLINDGTRELYAGENVNNLLVHDADIIMIISELNRCGAEAISVNGQRIGPRTSISCAGYTVRINDEVYARPFKIKAIGDGKRMAAALADPDGYGTSLKNWGVQFEVRLKDDLVIDAISKDYVYKYINKLQGR